MKRIHIFALAFAALALFPVRAQDASPSLSRAAAPYLLPQTIFVGDQGRLVVPLGSSFAPFEPFILELPAAEPGRPRGAGVENPILSGTVSIAEDSGSAGDLLIRRIELERRGANPRLLIDFIPYAPGILAFPSLKFTLPAANQADPISLSGLEVQVASILDSSLDSSQRVLADPAPPLPVPGTSLLVYGTMVSILLLLFLGIGGSLWGRNHFMELLGILRRRHHIRVMMKFLRLLRKESCRHKDGNPGHYLSLLSGQMREFLSFFTGVNCRSFTAAEFLDLPLGYPIRQEYPEAETWEKEDQYGLNPGEWQLFISGIFRDWDNQRFSGMGVKMTGLFRALKDAEQFVAALDRAEREISLPGVILGYAVAEPAPLPAGEEGK